MLNRLKSKNIRTMVPSFVYAVVSRVLQLVVAVLAARLLLPEGFGVYTYAIGVALLGGRIGGVGWHVLTERLVPRLVVEENWPLLRGFVTTTQWLTLISGIVSSAAVFLIAFILGSDDHLYMGLVLGGVLLPILLFRFHFRFLLASLMVPHKGIIVDDLLPAALMTAVLLMAVHDTLSPETALLYYTASSTAAVALAVVWIRQSLPRQIRHVTPTTEIRGWLKTSLPILLGTTSKLLMNKTDILMLAPLATMSAVGLYGASLRITVVQTAAVIVLSTILNPRISKSIASGRLAHVKNMFKQAVIFSLFSAGAFAVFLILFAEEILLFLFGAAFAAGKYVLMTLALAQVATAINTPASALMMLTGRQSSFARFAFFALSLNVLLNILFIPNMGAEGAALATCISVWALCVAQLVTCAKILSVELDTPE